MPHAPGVNNPRAAFDTLHHKSNNENPAEKATQGNFVNGVSVLMCQFRSFVHGCLVTRGRERL
jgi:hypothetical protein